MAESVRGHRATERHGARAGVDDRSRVRVAVAVHTNDVVHLLCEDAHARTSRDGVCAQ